MGGAVDTLILIDFQVGFENPVWGTRNNPQAEDQAQRLLQRWRETNQSVVHIRHISTTPGSPLSGSGTAFIDRLRPATGEVVFEKQVNSAFIGTHLESHLRGIGATDLTICGLTTPHCVSTSTRMAANLGFSVRLVADACAAFTANADVSFDTGPAFTAEEIHRSALAHLHGEFAQVCTCDRVLSV